MKNIRIIFKREYLSRVKNKSFIIMTLLAPIIFVGFYAAVILVAINSGNSDKFTTLKYMDQANLLSPNINGDTVSNYIFKKVNQPVKMQTLVDNEELAFLNIKDKDARNLDSVEFISKNTPSPTHSENIKEHLRNDVFKQNLLKLDINEKQLKKIKPKVKLKTLEANEEGELKKSSSWLKSGIGMFIAFIIYIFIFIYGTMVMRSTIEEKTNRIVEVIVSSVKPFQLMLGKILGVAAVGLTQFVLWIVLGTGLVSIITLIVGGTAAVNLDANAMQNMPNAMGQNTEAVSAITQGGMGEIFSMAASLPFAKIFTVFLLFFMGGFLLYSSMFAAIGSAVNQDTDAQQFMFPVSMPLIFGFIIAQSSVFQDPNGLMATVFSFIPFTSPVVMSTRAAFGVSWVEIFSSFLILLGTFLFMVWLSARIYRVGILMYGKKPKWKDFAKWIVRKN